MTRVSFRGAGLTLVELLLVVSLLLLLSGVAAMSLRNWTVVDLADEAQRFETAVRFTCAEAAATGKKLRMTFPVETDVGAPPVTLLIEDDPVAAPNAFTAYAGRDTASLFGDDVRVVSARLTGDSGIRVTEELSAEADDEREPVTFYPDGSSDSAEIRLVPRGAEGGRVAVVTIDGLNGTVETVIRDSEEEGFR